MGESHHTLLGWNFPINGLDDFSQTAYADDDYMPNATRNHVQKTFLEVEKASKIHKFIL